MIFKIVKEKTQIKSFSKVLKRILDKNIDQIRTSFESLLFFINDYGSLKDVDKIRNLTHDVYTEVYKDIKDIHELSKSISIIKYNIDYILSLDKPTSELANIKIEAFPYTKVKMVEQLEIITKLLDLSSVSLKKLPQTIHNFVSKIKRNDFSASGVRNKDIQLLEDFNHSVETIFQENIKETVNKTVFFKDLYNGSLDLEKLRKDIRSDDFTESIKKITVLPSLAIDIDNAIKYLIEISDNKTLNTNDVNVLVEDIEIIENYIHNIGIILKWTVDYIGILLKQLNQIIEYLK